MDGLRAVCFMVSCCTITFVRECHASSVTQHENVYSALMIELDITAPRGRCPACKHFAPIYEAAAQEIQASVESDNVFVSRADCATETVLCNRFNIKGYPTLLIGRPAQFLQVSLELLQMVAGCLRLQPGGWAPW